MRYMKSSHWPMAMPSCRLTASASKQVLWGTRITLLVLSSAMARVLLHTTRTVVGVTVVASVPSQEVANKR
ncbi:hypothetical protein D3C71_1677010 [compost metagenome]